MNKDLERGEDQRSKIYTFTYKGIHCRAIHENLQLKTTYMTNLRSVKNYGVNCTTENYAAVKNCLKAIE